jgi:hypothetical protein
MVNTRDQPVGDLRGGPAEFLVGVLDPVDVARRHRLAESRARLGLNLDGELVALDLAVALEGDPIEDGVAFDDADDDLAADDSGAHLGEHAGRGELLDRLVHMLLIRPVEIGADRVDVDPMGAFDDDGLGPRLGGHSDRAKRKTRGQGQPSEIDT